MIFNIKRNIIFKFHPREVGRSDGGSWCVWELIFLQVSVQSSPVNDVKNVMRLQRGRQRRAVVVWCVFIIGNKMRPLEMISWS